MKRKAFLFDADGTIINSIEDLRDAANYVLRTFGFPEHDTDAYRYFVGNGARKLIERAFPAGTPAQILDQAYALYSAYYPEHSMDQTAPYPGVVEALTQLKAEGYRLAVISNKPDNQTQLIIRALFDTDLFDLVTGKREEFPTKPDPALTFWVMEQLGLKAEECIFVGDSGVDMQTAKNCGALAVGVTWGLRDREELVKNGADQIVTTAKQLLEIS